MPKTNLPVGKILTEEAFQYFVWSSRAVEKFARNHKFTLGDRLQSSGLVLLELLVEATYTRNRSDLLRHAQLEIEKQRFLWRASHELKLLSADSYQHAARTLDSIGRGVGGWRKAHDARSARPAVRTDSQLQRLADGGAQGDQG